MGGMTRRVQMTMALSLGLNLGVFSVLGLLALGSTMAGNPGGADLLNLDQSTHIASWVDR